MTSALASASDLADLIDWLSVKGLKTCIVAVKDIPDRGRGLVVTEDVQPGTPLFTLPESALLNLNTLRAIYPTLITSSTNTTGLHASQLLSLHIFLHRPVPRAPSTDLHYGPYISSLPKNFDTHPLVWRFRTHDEHAQALLPLLPQPLRLGVESVWSRFMTERHAIAQFLAFHREVLVANTRFKCLSEEQLQETLANEEFLWAWLCVNTRSIYHKVVPSSKSLDNVTLCPLLDFANHSQVTNLGSSVPTFRAPTALYTGDEVFLNYGPHPDQIMFAEYGFITGDSERAQVDLGPELENLLANDTAQALKRSQLEQHGYWGDWTMHLMPTPHPSFRTMTALRLHCLHKTSDDALASWHSTITGHSAIVSVENEAFARRTLVRLCAQILGDCETRRKQVLTAIQDATSSPDWAQASMRTILALWDERMQVATAVLDASERGDEF